MSEMVPCPACGRPHKPTLVPPWVPDTVCACCGVPWTMEDEDEDKPGYCWVCGGQCTGDCGY